MISCPNLSGGLTLFEKEDEEQQREREYIYHLYPQTCPSFAPFHYHTHPYGACIFIFLVPSCHFHYPQIASAWVILVLLYTQLANNSGIDQQDNV